MINIKCVLFSGAILALAACRPEPLSAAPTAAAPAPVDAGTTWTPPAPATTVALDPLTSDGEWLVGTDIQPGTYRVTSTDGEMGYWALCSDLACEIGTGLISNADITGPSFLVIPPTAKAVELRDVTLTPTPN